MATPRGKKKKNIPPTLAGNFGAFFFSFLSSEKKPLCMNCIGFLSMPSNKNSPKKNKKKPVLTLYFFIFLLFGLQIGM
jgi:hypothetical protein